MAEKQKVAAITGAYRGLGAALSRELANHGYVLALGGRNVDDLETFTAEMGSRTAVLAVEMDVRSKRDCERFINATVRRFDRLDLLINNAGVWDMAKFEDVGEREIRDMFETNLFGAMYCSQAAVKVMRKQGSGHILNIGSVSGVDMKSSHVAYGASKAALIGFSGCLSNELSGTGIRVSVFSPDRTKTDLFRKHPERITEDFMDPDFVAKRIMEHIRNPHDDWHVVLRNRNH